MTPVNMKTHAWDIKGDRSTQWGNPYHIGKDGTRAEVLEKFRKLWMNSPNLQALAKGVLKGKRVGCWCKPLPCHLDIIAETVNADDK